MKRSDNFERYTNEDYDEISKSRLRIERSRCLAEKDQKFRVASDSSSEDLGRISKSKIGQQQDELLDETKKKNIHKRQRT